MKEFKYVITYNLEGIHARRPAGLLVKQVMVL